MAAVSLIAACSASAGTPRPTTNQSGAGPGDAADGSAATGADGAPVGGGMTADGSSIFGGDGSLSEFEACDDGNTNNGDGCAFDCLSVLPGFSCVNPGEKCRPIARCGACSGSSAGMG